ncbi:hypothetical protein BH11ARM2_BH11ARM2_06230 [soil metagenome]
MRGVGPYNMGSMVPRSSLFSRLAPVLALAALLAALAPAQKVVAWGNNRYGQTTVPSSALSGVVAVAAGYYHSLALKSDGSVVAWGYNGDGETTVPSSALSGVVAVSAGVYHSLALKLDGSVVAWGYNGDGETTVPSSALSGVVAVSAVGYHSLALKSDAWATLDQSSVYGGYAATGAVHLANAAGTGGVSVALVSSDAGVHVPTSVTVPQGATTAAFPVTTDYSFSPDRDATIRTTYGGPTAAAKLRVLKTATATAAFDLTVPLVLGSNQDPVLTVILSGAPLSDLVLDLSGPAGLGCPATLTVPAHQTSGSVALAPDASLALGTATVTVSYGGTAVASASLRVNPMLAAVADAPGTLVAGSTASGKVRLNAPARNAVDVALSSPDLALPGVVTVPAGRQEAPFSFSADPYAATHKTSVAASVGATPKTHAVKVLADDASGILLSPASVKGGTATTGEVRLLAITTVDTVVTLSSSKTDLATVPASVTIPAGQLSATFPITTYATRTTKTVKIAATKGAAVKAVLTITP